MTNTAITSESGLKLPTRSEEEARRAKYEAALLADGVTNPATLKSLVDQAIFSDRMISYNAQTLGLIAKMVGGGE